MISWYQQIEQYPSNIKIEDENIDDPYEQANEVYGNQVDQEDEAQSHDDSFSIVTESEYDLN